MAKTKAKANGKNKERAEQKREGSGIFKLLHRGLDRLNQLMNESVIMNYASDAERLTEYTKRSFLVRSVTTVKRRIQRKLRKKPSRELGTEQISSGEVGIFVPSTLHRSLKTRIGAAAEESKVLHIARVLIKSLTNVPMMSYGVFLFSFGLFTTVMQALLYFLLRPSDGAALDLFVGLALVLLSLPIMFRGYEPMLRHFEQSVVGNLLFRVLRSQSTGEKVAKVKKPTLVFFLSGMAFGLLTYFAPPMFWILAMGVAIAAICVLYVPETGVCLIIFMLPFFTGVEHASTICAGMMLYTGLCFLLKVLVGKRSLTWGLLDVAVLLFGLTVLSTTLAGGRDNVNAAFLYTSMISGYFTLANLLRSKSWIRRSLTALSLSSLIVSVTGIIDWIWDLGIRIALLDDPSVATVYLLAVTVPILAMVFNTKGRRKKAGYFLVFALNVAYFVLISSPIGFFALSVELLLFFLVYSKKTVAVLLVLLLLVPFVSYVIFPNFGNLYNQIFTTGQRDLWGVLSGVFANAPLSGIGMSDRVLLNAIANDATVALQNSNIWLRLLIQIGIPGLILWAIVILLRYISGLTLIRQYGAKDWATCLHYALLASLTGLLIAGNVFYVWSDNRMLLLFWMLGGISSALVRTAKRNDETKNSYAPRTQRDGIQYVDVDIRFATSAPNDKIEDASEERMNEYES